MFGSDSASGALQGSQGSSTSLPLAGGRIPSPTGFSSDTKVFPTAWLHFSSAGFALKNAAKQIELGLRAERGGKEKFGDKEHGQPTPNLELILISIPAEPRGPRTAHSQCLRTSCSPCKHLAIPLSLPDFFLLLWTQRTQKYSSIHATGAGSVSSHCLK